MRQHTAGGSLGHLPEVSISAICSVVNHGWKYSVQILGRNNLEVVNYTPFK